MGHILLIAEKPDAMRKIAQTLAEDGTLKKIMSRDGVDCYSFRRNLKEHIIVSSVGHLFQLTPNVKGEWVYPVFDAEWMPSFRIQKKSIFSKKYFEAIKKFAYNADDFINCCDFDTEGSVIGSNILRFICNAKKAKRMKFSTLTKEELISSYNNMSNNLDYGQIDAGLTRHWLDWIWGLNLTRALTTSIKHQGYKGFKVISTGRVQGPTLALLLERELKIRRFKPKTYWQLLLYCKLNNEKILAKHKRDYFWDKNEADFVVKSCTGKKAIVKDVEKKIVKQMAPYPFNTTTLQSESYSHFKFSPLNTLHFAESLYQMGAISYPRTSSQKLPRSIDYKGIIKSISFFKLYNKFCDDLLNRKKLIPREGPKIDYAHPAIYPTSEIPNLQKISSQQKKIYDLIVRRFLSSFSRPAIREIIHVILSVDENIFHSYGRRSVDIGWTEIYSPYITFKEKILPDVEIGQELEISNIQMVEKQTTPPERYSQGSIIEEMEKRSLGTRATRSIILQTLYERKYISGERIRVTKLGEVVTNLLKEFCREIVNEELTVKFEQAMELVQNKEKRKEEIIEESLDFMFENLMEIKKKEKELGDELFSSLMNSLKEDKKMGTCPKCKGEIILIKSGKSGKIFAGCSNYPQCTNSYPLPQKAGISKTNKICEECLTPIIYIKKKGKKSFKICLDPNCSSKLKFKIQTSTILKN